MKSDKTIRLLMMPQEFPCGEQSSCCGPVGQSEEEIQSLKSSIEKELGYEVEVLNVNNDGDMRDHARIAQLFQTFGRASLPIVALEDEVVSMGDCTPGKVVAAIRENAIEKRTGKENNMLVNENLEQGSGQESMDNTQPCCPSSSDGGSCCTSGSDGGGRGWKILVFLVIVIAAGVVLARSLIHKSNSTCEQTQEGFAAIEPEENSDTPSPPTVILQVETPAPPKSDIESPTVAKNIIEEDVSDKAVATLWGPELDSLASLNKVAAETDGVFIFLAAEDKLKMESVTTEIEAAVKKMQARGKRICAFKLKKDAPYYAR
ncbi:MAG: hypothetical protein JSV16_11420, partial [Candidatus Hydrogenedentota bacterium]